MQHSSMSGTSQRWSPASLDRSMFDAGAKQSQGPQYDYAQTSAMTATMNAYYPYATQAGYTNYMQTAQPSYTHSIGHSSSYHYPDNLYPANFQITDQRIVPKCSDDRVVFIQLPQSFNAIVDQLQLELAPACRGHRPFKRQPACAEYEVFLINQMCIGCVHFS
ncbi:hypothetical protein EWM64_g3941 [Hericium alpestre]|uniref:Uncharacterized protein n=1 Tax=Hericium alpestre TaxID=135208 RepID=A0A4Z0A301_9AGAM|nr:hypothetical protein EWM64_g3941 [Hericium alpestre]